MRARPIDKRERELERKGPVWRAPLVIDVLRNLPFLRHVPARAVEARPRLAAIPRCPATLLCTAGSHLLDAAAWRGTSMRLGWLETCVPCTLRCALLRLVSHALPGRLGLSTN